MVHLNYAWACAHQPRGTRISWWCSWMPWAAQHPEWSPALGLPSLFAWHFFCTVGLRDVLSWMRHILNAQNSIILNINYCEGAPTDSLKAEVILLWCVCLPKICCGNLPLLFKAKVVFHTEQHIQELSYRGPRTRKKSKRMITIQAAACSSKSIKSAKTQPSEVPVTVSFLIWLVSSQ